MEIIYEGWVNWSKTHLANNDPNCTYMPSEVVDRHSNSFEHVTRTIEQFIHAS